MAKGKKTTSSDRKAQKAKKGKKHGQIHYPTPLSPERQKAREEGEKQFVANKPLSIDREATVIIFNKKTGLFESKTKKISTPADCEFDPTRGRIIYTPSAKASK